MNLKEAWEREQRNPGLAIASETLAVDSESIAMEREALINELGFLLNRFIDLEGN